MEQNKKNNFSTLRETAFLAVGELIVSLVVIGVYLLIDKFSYKVVTGAALGTLVTVLNYMFLTLSVNKAINNFLEARGEGEMDEEQLEKFTGEHSLAVQNAAKKSYIIRTLSMVVTLVLAFVLDWFEVLPTLIRFEVLPTLIPLLMLRPILYAEALLTKKKGD